MSLTKDDLEQIRTIVIDVVEPRFTAMDTKFEAMDVKIDGVRDEMMGAMTMFAEGIITQLDAIYDDMAVVKEYVKDHGFRIARLERKAAAL